MTQHPEAAQRLRQLAELAATRDQDFRTLHDLGWSTRAIARLANIHPQTVGYALGLWTRKKETHQ
jgi:IS30 family transposase